MTDTRETSRGRTDPDRLEELYETARAMAPDARARFLDEACLGDDSTASELRSLLAVTDSAEAFFADLSQSIVSPAVGHSIGPYRLTGILGAGGMGTVYRAHDSRLDREVALKLLPLHLSTNPEVRERFLVEARAAAALEHPNVCSVHEIGNADDGRPFIAMACYDGETLKERLTRGPIAANDAVAIAIQLARGLSAAHARGIVHRDVKPGNIMLCADGTVRLLDFGLAKVADVSLTGPGITPGTVAYMSPEQTRGDPVNHLSDLWSLGVVLYEMLAGKRPFRGGNDRAVVQAILHEAPAPLPISAGEIRPDLRLIVNRLLRRAPAERYRSALELIGELERTGPVSAIESMTAWLRRHRRSSRVVVAGVVATAGLLALTLALRHRSTNPPSAGTAGRPSTLAVLPFTVRGPGLEVWHEGMVDLLSMGLDGAAGLRAVDSRTLLAAWHQNIGAAGSADLARALGVARQTHARYALVGSVVGAGPQIRLAADIYDAETGKMVGPVQVDGPADSMLALVDRLGMQTLGLILETAPSQTPSVNLAAITTSSLIALKAYLDGDEHYRRSEFRAASEAWERAVRADTLFALAYLGLADSYAWYSYQPFAQNLERATRLAARLPERDRIRVQMRRARFNQDPDALAKVREAVRRYPDAADAWYELGETYFHDAKPMAGPAQAESAFVQAATLQPTMAPYRSHLLDLAFIWRGDSASIARELELYGRLAPDEPRTRASRIAFALAFGGDEARDSALAALRVLDADAAGQTYWLLQHPRFRAVRAAIYPLVLSRLDAGGRARAIGSHLMNLGFVDGRLREALALLADPATPAIFRNCGAIYYESRGLPVPLSAMQRGRAVAQTDTAPLNTGTLQCAADYAARFGDWNEHAKLLARQRRMAARLLASGDSARARSWQGNADASEGYGLMRRGRKAEALRAFEKALSGEHGQHSLWFVGQLALELGKLDEAERAFRALWNQRDAVPAHLELARILERTGRPAEAREAYQFVANAWRNADPELQPFVEEAREAIRRTGGRRE